MPEAAVLERLWEACDARGLSPTDLSHRIGAPLPTITPWRAREKMPSARYLIAIPSALQINGHWLLTGEGSMDAPAAGGFEDGVRHAATTIADAVARLSSSVGNKSRRRVR